jgi:hypothetical protein
MVCHWVCGTRYRRDSPDNLISERDALVRDHIKLWEERDMIAAAYNSLGTEHDALLTSLRWRVTGPLRLLRGLLSQ